MLAGKEVLLLLRRFINGLRAAQTMLPRLLAWRVEKNAHIAGFHSASKRFCWRFARSAAATRATIWRTRISVMSYRCASSW